MTQAADWAGIIAGTTQPSVQQAATFYRQLGGQAPGGPYNGLTVPGTEPFVATADSSAVVGIGAGTALLGGVLATWSTGDAGTHSNVHATLDRIDSIILEMDWEQARDDASYLPELKIVEGTPAATAWRPDIVEQLLPTASALWQVRLYDVLCAADVGAGAPTIETADVTNRMRYLGIGPWTAPTFASGWADHATYQGVTYRVVGGNRVELYGATTRTGAATADTAILTIPAHLRPRDKSQRVFMTQSNGAARKIYIDASDDGWDEVAGGSVWTLDAVGDTEYLILDMAWDIEDTWEIPS